MSRNKDKIMSENNLTIDSLQIIRFLKDFHILVVLSFKHLKILIFELCSKFCSDVLRGLQYLVDKVKFHGTFSIKSIVIKNGRAKLANIRVAYDGNTCSRCVNDNIAFISMIKSIFRTMPEPYDLKLLFVFSKLTPVLKCKIIS